MTRVISERLTPTDCIRVESDSDQAETERQQHGGNFKRLILST